MGGASFDAGRVVAKQTPRRLEQCLLPRKRRRDVAEVPLVLLRMQLRSDVNQRHSTSSSAWERGRLARTLCSRAQETTAGETLALPTATPRSKSAVSGSDPAPPGPRTFRHRWSVSRPPAPGVATP